MELRGGGPGWEQMALRKQLNESLASKGGPKLSVNDFVIKASALVGLLP